MTDTLQPNLLDIQGNVLAGFNTDFQVFVGLTADLERGAEIAAWLAGLASQMTTVADVRAQRAAIRRPEANGRDLSWLALGLGSDLLGVIRPDVFIKDEGFNAGFAKRARAALGDRSDPASWRAGCPEKRIDVLLITGSNRREIAETRARLLVSKGEANGLKPTYFEVAQRIEDLEHFGFRDGVSQPKVRNFDPGGTVGAGYVVFGYEREAGTAPYIPAEDPLGYVRNGSLMVFRRLTQDVAAFQGFCSDKAAVLAAQWPGLSSEHLAALLVGRWPSGALVSVSSGTDPGRMTNDDAFDFSDDNDGRSCPLGAHIRKVNPREGFKDEVVVPRIIRRGIPFGPVSAEARNQERGLAFVSYQTSIVKQFEFLTNSWMNSPAKPGSLPGHDMLVGESSSERSMTIQGPGGKVTVADGGSRWVHGTGGAYLFAPGRAALARIAAPRAISGLWRVRKAFAVTIDRIKQNDGLPP